MIIQRCFTIAANYTSFINIRSKLTLLLLYFFVIASGNASAFEFSNISIISSSDDAEEAISTGKVDLTSSDIDLSKDRGGVRDQYVGLRFKLNIPSDSVISNAYVQFSTNEVSKGKSHLVINIENSANAVPFSTNNLGISSRKVTTTSVTWEPPSWLTIGQKGSGQRTPDLSAMIQEIIDSSSWQANNYIAFILNGRGTRSSVSYDGSLSNVGSTELAPQLYIEYSPKTDPVPEPEPIDNIPVAQLDSLTTLEETAATINVLDNDTGLEDGGISVTINGTPLRGSVSIAEGGLITYLPNSGYIGPDVFTYQITDVDGDTSSANVNVTVNAIDHLPNANNDTIITGEDMAATVNVLDNDTGLEDGAISITISSVPSNGSVSLAQSGVITYTPNSGYAGVDTFIYRITDADGDASSATVNVTVNTVGHTSVVITVSEDAEEETSTGTIDSVSSDLELIYEPNGSGEQRIGLRFPLNIPVNSTITNAYIQFTTDEVSTGDSNLIISAEYSTNAAVFSSNDFDISSRSLTASSVNWTPANWNIVGQNDIDQRTPNLGTIVQEVIGLENWLANNHVVFILNGSGTRTSISYDGALLNYGSTDYAPQLHIEYILGGGAGPAPVPVDNIPVAQQDMLTTSEEMLATVNVLDNDIGLEDGGITVTIISAPSNGSVSIGQNGALTYTPSNGYIGSDTFIYRVTDVDGDFDSANVNINIISNNIDHTPVANADRATTQAVTPVSIDVLSNDTGIEDGPIAVSITSSPSEGSVTIKQDNTITYTPNSEHFGSDSFVYSITDIDSDSAVANVAITVVCTSGACTKTIRVSWNANPEVDLFGYYIHHGMESGVYTDKVWVGNVTSYDFETDDLTVHFFAISAISTTSDESGLSEEVSVSL